MKFTMHLHTNFSPDSNITPEEIISQCKKFGIDAVGITDHNTADGAIKYKKEIENQGIKVIIGEEIRTNCGEIIGLFLNKTIQSKRDGKWIDLEFAIEEIKKQDGLVIIPHPFDKMRFGIGKKNIEKFKDQIDGIEIFNARTKISLFDKQAEKYAKNKKFFKTIGPDAHVKREIGNAIIEMPDFKNKEEFLKSIQNKGNKYYMKRFKFVDIIKPTINKILKKLFKKNN